MTDLSSNPVNGVANPQPVPQQDAATTAQAAIKRKRVDSTGEEAQVNGDAPQQATDNAASANTKQQIDDFITVLKKVDTSPSILDRQLLSRNASAEPEQKRPRSEDGAASILARAAANAYKSLDDVLSDLRVAANSLKEELKSPSVVKNHFKHLSAHQLATNIDLVLKKAEDLCQREKARNGISRGQSIKTENASAALTNGVSPSIPGAPVAKVGDGKLVLTLFGGAAGARDGKQLFSSLQHGVKDQNGTISVSRPLRETALPNGISTTEIVGEAATAEDKKAALTLGQLFTSGTPLPFQPPRTSRSSSSRQVAPGWSFPAVSETTRSRNNVSYYQSQVNTGMWLDYKGASSSPDMKRKQRERALSLSGVRPSLTDAETDEQEAKELDALFCSAYSSFAPTRDDSQAVVPQSVLNKLWWQRSGEKAFERLAKNFEHVAMDEANDMTDAPGKDEVAQFQDAIEHWDEVIDPSLTDAKVEKSVQEKDAEEVLEGISELLETLNSYQRNRNLAAPVLPKTGAPPLVGTPNVAEPDEEEARTYSILKSQLSLMISTLPPYAVAKLNSDQLSELNISTKIPILTEPYKGVLEEDEQFTHAKLSKMTAATSSRVPTATPAPHHRSGSSAQFGNQYNTAPRPPSGTAQYYQNSTPARTPAPIRPPQTAGPVPYAAPRPLSGQGYQQQGIRPQGAYGSPAAPIQTPRPIPQPQYAQNAAAYYSTPGAQQRYPTNGVPNTAPQGLRYQPPAPPANFQPRPPVPGGSGMPYSTFPNGAGTPIQRQPSPQKPIPTGPGIPTPGYAAHVQAQQQARGYGTPTPAAQNYYGGGSMGLSAGVPMPPTMQQQIANGGPGLEPSATNVTGMPAMPISSGVLGPTGYRTTMSPAEEANLMARQRAMAAMQGPYQAQARTAAQSGSPMPMTPGNPNRMGGA